jgi:hypothetical protein
MRNSRDAVKGEILKVIRTEAFQAVTFYDEAQKRQLVLLYSLGEDGIIREYNGQDGWRAYPVQVKEELK